MAGSVFDELGDAFKQVGDVFAQALNGGSSQQRTTAPAPEIHVEVKPGQVAGAVPLECPKCGATIQQTGDRAAAFCSYCGTRLLVDDGSARVTYTTVDETRIRELEIEEARERRQMELEEKRRPGRVRLSIVLGGAGFLMMAVGWFAGSASGDSNSPWYMFTMMGFLCLAVVAWIWLMALPPAPRDSEGKRGRRR